jgi:hypothetical protein
MNLTRLGDQPICVMRACPLPNTPAPNSMPALPGASAVPSTRWLSFFVETRQKSTVLPYNAAGHSFAVVWKRTSLIGDFNGDGKVDAGDFVAWTKAAGCRRGSTPTGALISVNPPVGRVRARIQSSPSRRPWRC